MKKLVLMLAAMALIAGTAQAYTPEAPGPELVTNGDFESGTFVPGGVPDGWAIAGETATTGWVPGDDGTLVEWRGPPAAATKIAQVTGPSIYGIAGAITTVDIAVEENTPYFFSFDAKSVSSTSWFSVQVAYLNSEGGRISYDNEWVGSYFWLNPPTNTSANAWFVPSYSATGITSGGWWSYPENWMEARSPFGAVTATIHFFAYTDCVHQFDNVSLREIPEPLTLSLLGLGGLMLRRRKK
jgi:hypothetical protein